MAADARGAELSRLGKIWRKKLPQQTPSHCDHGQRPCRYY